MPFTVDTTQPIKVAHYSEEDGLPSLWDDPHKNTTKVVIFRDIEGNLLMTNNPEAIAYCEPYVAKEEPRERINAMVRVSGAGAVLSDMIDVLYEQGRLGETLDKIDQINNPAREGCRIEDQ